MPWARLHGLRGYRDLAIEIPRDQVAATVNLTGSLLDQLGHYAEGGDDDHLALTRAPADGLSEAQAVRVRTSFALGNPAMIQSSDAYAALAASDRGDVAALRDRQVWSTLAWFGATALQDYPDLVGLRRKGRGFSEADKERMLAVQAEILSDLPARIAKIGSGPATLSVTPYDHPILPLVIDSRSARRCLPDLPEDIPVYRWPDDARSQLARSRDRVAALQGSPPRGLWPSEGAVSPEVVRLAAEAGYRWLASDDGVLRRSERSGGPGAGPWELGHGMVGFFRDHELSDRVGFVYSRMDPRRAVDDLLAGIGSRKGRVLIALDGENPWEAFDDAGAAFRAGLHRALRDRVACDNLDDAAEDAPVGRITHLHTGSWIGANLAVWFGHEDDRRAWAALAEARRAAEDAPADRRRAALEHLAVAAGSDWTWWYGDDFVTAHALEFDALFRDRVAAAWRALGRSPPDHLRRPLVTAQVDRVEPVALVSPSLDGSRSLGWGGAGRVVWPRGSSMASGGPPVVEALRYGFDAAGALWLQWVLGTPRRPQNWLVSCEDVEVRVSPSPGAQGASGGVAVAVGAQVVVARVTVAPGQGVDVQLVAVGPDRSDPVGPPAGPARIDVPADLGLAYWSV